MPGALFQDVRAAFRGLVKSPGLTAVAVAILTLGRERSQSFSGLAAGFVYGVSPEDPATFLLVAGILVAVACLASCLPALRASRVDPVEVLK